VSFAADPVDVTKNFQLHLSFDHSAFRYDRMQNAIVYLEAAEENNSCRHTNPIARLWQTPCTSTVTCWGERCNKKNLCRMLKQVVRYLTRRFLGNHIKLETKIEKPRTKAFSESI